MPLDILSQWFWQPIPAMTAEQQDLIRSAAKRLHQPPAVAPIYRFIEPTPEAAKPEPEPVKKVKAEPKPETVPEPGGLDLFKSLFRS
jgi:hypothetical protein